MNLFGYEILADNGNFGGAGFASIDSATAGMMEALEFARGAVSCCVYMADPGAVVCRG